MRVKASVKPHESENITINTEFIRLDALLKFKGLAQTGGHAKMIIQDGLIKVNNEKCIARGKKIKAGDTVSFQNIDYHIVNEN